MAKHRTTRSTMMDFIQHCLSHAIVLNAPFAVAWIGSPLMPVGIRIEDDFGCYIMGGEL